MSHKLQPLDVGIFSVLQRAWSAHSRDLAAKRITIDHHNFIPEYLAVREKAITLELIIKAFQKTGISPFNPSMFLEEDFRPSMASSLGLHLPTSYPDLTPSLPPAIPTDDEDSNDNFILGHSSDVEMDSGNDKDNSDDKGCEVKDDFTHVDPNDKMQATPCLIPTCCGQPPQTSSQLAKPWNTALPPCPQNSLALHKLHFLIAHPHSPHGHIHHQPHQPLKSLTGRRPRSNCLKTMTCITNFPRKMPCSKPLKPTA